MHAPVRLLALVCGFSLLGLADAAQQHRTPPTAAAVHPWTVAGGDIGIRWNRELLHDLGMRLTQGPRASASDGSNIFPAEPAQGLRLRLDDGYVRGFGGGELRARGGYTLQTPGGIVDLRDFRLVPDASRNELRLDLSDGRGTRWFHVDRIMGGMLEANGEWAVSSSDIRISQQLARMLGHPEVAGWVVGELQLDVPVTMRGSGGERTALAPSIQWSGDPAPDGGTYQNDLMMKQIKAQYLRCDGCTGEGGNGRVVIAPSSTLRNNVNQGDMAATIPGDPLGTSTARYAAGIPWYTKFSGQFPPYDNDQHPFLIWNMYRIDSDGSLQQVGRSGVKQAFLTTNVGCLDQGDHNDHVLGRGCSDTYSISNNDYTNALSPRTEILAGSGRWGRCGSTFDPDCDGRMDNLPNDSYSQRMIVRESDLSPGANPGASWLFESWYVAREDIDIYNSMATLQTTQTWNGSVWDVGYSGEKLGPAIDRWVGTRNRGQAGLARGMMNEEIAVNGGHVKVAVRAIDLGNGSWRYHYAVMNFDATFFTTSGAEPDLRVLSNVGFGSFAVRTSATASAPSFHDGDDSSADDWQFSQANGMARWTGNAANNLFWGTLYSFSITSNSAPKIGTAQLRSADAAATAYNVRTLVPR